MASAAVTTAPGESAAAEIGPADIARLRLDCFSAGIGAAIPYESEVAMAHWSDRAVERAANEHMHDLIVRLLMARNAELEAEVVSYADELGEMLDELKRANLPVDLSCTGRHLLTLIEIDKGMTVQALSNAIQTVAYDMRARFMPKYKGKVKMKLICQPDPNATDAMIISAEVTPETPAQTSGGRLTLATDGTIATRRESAQAFQLKMVSAEPDPLSEMYGPAEGEALRKLLVGKGIAEITVGHGDDKRKIRLAGGQPKAA
jgi:hypothetical protein